MKKLFLIIITLVIINARVFSQSNDTTSFYGKMNYIFNNIDKSQITTGLLREYGLQAVDPAYFNGIPADSNYVNMDTWNMLYAGRYSSVSKYNDFFVEKIVTCF